MKGATQQAATFLALFAGPLLLAPATKGASCSDYAGDVSKEMFGPSWHIFGVDTPVRK